MARAFARLVSHPVTRSRHDDQPQHARPVAGISSVPVHKRFAKHPMAEAREKASHRLQLKRPYSRPRTVLHALVTEEPRPNPFRASLTEKRSPNGGKGVASEKQQTAPRPSMPSPSEKGQPGNG
jgi:hypothetical protein